MTRTFIKGLLIAVGTGCFATPLTASAASVVGTVEQLEVWRGGNVAFTLSSSVSACNGQFILNTSAVGTRNIYTALLSAKLTGTRVDVRYSACGAAEGYGGNYNLVDFVFVLQ